MNIQILTVASKVGLKVLYVHHLRLQAHSNHIMTTCHIMSSCHTVVDLAKQEKTCLFMELKLVEVGKNGITNQTRFIYLFVLKMCVVLTVN